MQACQWPKRLQFFLSPAAHVLIEKTVSEALLVIMLQVGQQHMRIILNTVYQFNMIGPGQPILLAVSALRSERYQALHNMTHKLRLFSGLA